MLKACGSFVLCVIFVSTMSCSRENELDTAIDEALREADFAQTPDETPSIRYFEEKTER